MTVDPSFFLQHLKEPRCVGFGEIGLDYKTICRCSSHHGKNEKKDCVQRKIRKQVKFLEHMLPFIPEDVIVVHTNDEGAANDMMETLIEERRTKQGINWHCFMEDSSLANRLLQTFPHLFLSFRSGSVEDHETRNSLLHVPSSCLLLESDAPYLDVFEKEVEFTLGHCWTCKRDSHHQKSASVYTAGNHLAEPCKVVPDTLHSMCG